MAGLQLVKQLHRCLLCSLRGEHAACKDMMQFKALQLHHLIEHAAGSSLATKEFILWCIVDKSLKLALSCHTRQLQVSTELAASCRDNTTKSHFSNANNEFCVAAAHCHLVRDLFLVVTQRLLSCLIQLCPVLNLTSLSENSQFIRQQL